MAKWVIDNQAKRDTKKAKRTTNYQLKRPLLSKHKVNKSDWVSVMVFG